MNATHSLPTVAEMTFGAGDGMPDCSGTSLRFGTAPAGLNANAFRYYRSTNPVRVDPLERETGCSLAREPTLRSGAVPRRVKCFAFIALQFESLPRRPLERETGFGPATFALARQRSTTEPLPHKIVSWCDRRDLNSHIQDTRS